MNIKKIAIGAIGLLGLAAGYQLYELSEINKYGPKNVELSSEVFKKNTLVHNQVQSQIRGMSPKDAYLRWNEVNDSLGLAEIKAIKERINDGKLKAKIDRELKGLTIQEALDKWKAVNDSLSNLPKIRLNVVR